MTRSMLDEIRESNRATVTMAEVSRLLEVDVRTISRACRDGQLPAVMVGRRMLIPREPLIALLSAKESA